MAWNARSFSKKLKNHLGAIKYFICHYSLQKALYIALSLVRGRESQTMFYKAKAEETGNMWDTWLYLYDGTYYLYYLAKSGPQWDNISMATSPDGVHWEELGSVLRKRDDVTWMGTGSTWSSPNLRLDRRFQMNFSEWKGPRQTIFFAESPDLIRWIRLGDEYEFKQDTRWYELDGRWDCIYIIPRPGGGLYGYWTATPKPETGGEFGFGQSMDGVTWEALEPPKTYGVGDGEVGAVEKIGDKYYMMFGTGGLMVTLIADRPEGPFYAAEKNFRLLSGHTYFSRFFPVLDGLLVNHHSIARDGEVYLAPLKQAVVGDEDILRLGWWSGNEEMKHEEIDVKPLVSDGDTSIVMLGNTFDVDRGVMLEGEMTLPSGLYIECEQEHGAAIMVGIDGTAELGQINRDGSGFQSEKQVDREMSFGEPARFRLLLEHSLMEFYLDDILIECFSLPARTTGRIGMVRSGDSYDLRQLQAWQ